MGIFQYDELLSSTKEMARRAGQEIIRIWKRDIKVKTKQDGSPLTLADQASHEIITTALSRLTPGILVVSEEKYIERDQRCSLPAYWLVDPLDGTKEFVNKNPDFTVNIALIENQQPTLGVIYAPALEQLYFAVKDTGAFSQIGIQGETPICAYPETREILAVKSRSHLTPQTEEFLDKIGVRQSISRGSSVKMCAVAEGSADLYARLGPTFLWDTAAGCIIARESGCGVLNLLGTDLAYDLGVQFRHQGFVVFSKRQPGLKSKILTQLQELKSSGS